MSNYTKLTNFASKDSLATGNPLKVIKGTEIDDEFEGIETAIGTKADLASPTFTGTPAAPTATTGTNTTQIATTAFVQAQVDADIAAIPAVDLTSLYPVGSIYMNASDSTNPATLIGFGTWVAFGAGRVPVGIDAGQTEFDTAEETGGAKTHALTSSEMPAHGHSIGGNGLTIGTQGTDTLTSGAWDAGAYTNTHTNNNIINASNGTAHNNLQPYIVVYMWKRTA